MPGETAADRATEPGATPAADAEPLHRPWRAAIAGGELLLAGAAVWLAVLMWSSAMTTIGAETTRYAGNRIGVAMALGAVAALLVVDALRQLLLAVRTRRREAPEPSDLQEPGTAPWSPLPPRAEEAAGAADQATADDVDADPHAARFDGDPRGGVSRDGDPHAARLDGRTQPVAGWAETDTERVLPAGRPEHDNATGGTAAVPPVADDSSPPAGTPAQRWPARDEDT